MTHIIFIHAGGDMEEFIHTLEGYVIIGLVIKCFGVIKTYTQGYSLIKFMFFYFKAPDR